MANQVFNVALGRTVELYNNVRAGTPSTARLVVMVLSTTGLESDAILKDKITFADVLSGTTDEVTNTGYARKILTSADIPAWSGHEPDQSGNKWDLDIPDQTWLAVSTAPPSWSRLVVGYDPTSNGVTNTLIIPLTSHDFVVTPDGSDITAQISALGFFTAS